MKKVRSLVVVLVMVLMLGCFVVAVVSSHAFSETSAVATDELDYDPEYLSCHITSVEGGDILGTVINDKGVECYAIQWYDPVDMLTIMDAWLTEYFRDYSSGWSWSHDNQLLMREQDDGTIRFVYVPVIVNSTQPDDLACRLEKIGDGEIMAEVWKGDRYYYVVEFPAATTSIYDAYLQCYYSIHRGDLTWDDEKCELILTSDEEWEAQEDVYHHDGDYILLGRVGADANASYTIPLDWAISR